MKPLVIRCSMLVFILLALGACGSSRSSDSSTGAESTGQVSLSLSNIPPGLQCIQVTASGSTNVTQTFPVALDAGTTGTLSLGLLPLGSLTISAQAFNVTCANINSQRPSWVADKQVVTIQGGVVTALTLTFRPNDPVTATTNFVGNVMQIAPGYLHIGALFRDGTVEAAGQLSVSPYLYNASVFGTVPGLSNIAQLAPSIVDQFDCAAMRTGTAECWGINLYGALGNGTTTNSITPVAVSGLTKVTQMSSGGEHVCAVQSNTVYCWGYNFFGQLGDNTTTNAATPVSTSAPMPVSVAAGGFHTCMTTTYGNVYCWGYNAYGQIGNNSTTDQHAPLSVSGLNAITQLALGYAHTCALRADGSVICWGYNAYGQLGVGNTTDAHVPTQVTISNVQQIVASYYATCARRSDGTVWCWGYDGYGTVGDGTGGQAVVSPTQVRGLPASTAIAGGNANFCSVGTDSTIQCWGDNTFGQLGNGTTNDAFIPTPAKL